MEKRLEWAHKLGGVELLWISQVSHTMLARLMESQIWYQLTSSVGRWAQQRTMDSACPNAKHFSISLYTTLVHSCHCGAEAQREPICIREFMSGFPKRNCLGLQQSPLSTQSPLVFTARSCGDLPSWHWNPGLWGLVWAPEICLLNFCPHGYGPAHFASTRLLLLWIDVVSPVP